MKKLLLIYCMMPFHMHAMQEENKIITSAVLQALVQKLEKDPSEHRSHMHYRTAPGGNQATLSKKGILYDGCDKESQDFVIGRYSDGNKLRSVSIIFDNQIIKADQTDNRGQYLLLFDQTIWRFWLDKDSRRWIFMKEVFEVLP